MFNIKENKVVYQYDAEGVLLKAIVLDATDRAENGDWIYPTRTTPVVPPLSKKGYELVWKNGAWQYRVYTPKPLKTDDEKKARALAELDSRYTSDKQELSAQYLDAAMAEDTDTMTAIKDELAALNAKYDADYAELNK